MKQLYCLTCGKELKDSTRFTCDEECFNNLNLEVTEEGYYKINSATKMKEYQDRYCVYCGQPFNTNIARKKSCSIECCDS